MRRFAFWALAILVVLALIAGFVYWQSRDDSAASGNEDEPLIITRRAEVDSLREEITIRGTLERVEKKNINLPAGGSVSSVSLEDGDIVNDGDLLYAIGGRPAVAMSGDLAFFRTLDVGSRGPDVAQLEAILFREGHDPGVVDELYTTQTRGALAEWQQTRGYPSSAPEAGEVITLALSGNPTGYAIGAQNAATITISPGLEGTASIAEPPAEETGSGAMAVPLAAALQGLPMLTIQSNAAVVEEGESAPFVIVADVAPTTSLTVNLTFAGSAATGTDYNVPPNQTVIFPAGAISVPVNINTIEDLTVEADETLDISIAPGTGYSASSTASTTIIDDDLPQLSITSSGTVTEGNTGTFTITANVAPLTDLQIPLTSSATDLGNALNPNDTIATAGADYEALPTSVILPAGQESIDIAFFTETDDIVEGDEEVSLSIDANDDAYDVSGSGSATITIEEASANITPVITITSNATSVNEGGNANFLVESTTAVSEDIDLNLAVGGTAIPGTDYTNPDQDDFVLPGGQTQVTIQVATRQDDEIEPEKTITVDVLPGVDYITGSPASATTTLQSEDVPELTLGTSNPTVSEGGTQQFIITADAAPAEDISISYQATGAASTGSDYDPLRTDVVLRAGQTSVAIPLVTVSDTVFELDEDVVMQLANNSGYTIANLNTATITIVDGGKKDGPVITVTSSAATTPEGQTVSFTIGASAASSRDIDINLVLGGTAINSVDYTFPSNDLVLPAGQTSIDVRATTRQDTLVEPDKTISVGIVGGSGYTVGTPSEASTVIESDDLPELTLRDGNLELGEGDSAAFIIEADQPVADDTSINYVVGGSATPGRDFETLTGTVIMPAGQQSLTIPVYTLNDDIVFEPTDMVIGDWPARVGTVYIEEGQATPEGTPAIELTEDEFTIKLNLSPTNRADLQVGMVVEVEIDASDIDTLGTVTELDENASVGADGGGESYEGRVEIDTDFDAVQGSTAVITVVTSEAASVVVVPIAAVLQGPDGDEVRIIDADTGAVRRSVVETGLDEGSFIEIKSGVEEGEIVIVEVQG